MKIGEALQTLKAEVLLGRTPSGWPINEQTIESLKAAIQDAKNHENDVNICQNCSIIQSSLLISSGCPNCNYKGRPS